MDLRVKPLDLPIKEYMRHTFTSNGASATVNNPLKDHIRSMQLALVLGPNAVKEAKFMMAHPIKNANVKRQSAWIIAFSDRHL
mmetsp:Transcript_11828/g.34141  ORF Transcript_11828/g.34141 Transcript_11828/m.34141 type:complete len:83 (-) Transcript_11828:76-324(-)